MKKSRIFIFVTSIWLSFLIGSCGQENVDNSDEGKGLVQIAGFGYENDTLSFKLSIQYGSPGASTELEYEVYDGSSLISDGVARTSVADGGLNIFFETPDMKVVLPQNTYAGKTILIWADPEHKQTSSTYTTDQFVDLYKKKEVMIPN